MNQSELRILMEERPLSVIKYLRDHARYDEDLTDGQRTALRQAALVIEQAAIMRGEIDE